jgi:hypothetical protein
MIMVSEAGGVTPQQYDGTTVSDASYTGSGLTATDLRRVTLYRDRLYFAGDGFDLWYGGSAAVTGALTKLDLTSVFKRSGLIWALGTWSADDGGGSDDRLVVISDQGEAVVYSGSYPGGNDWGRLASYNMPAPISGRGLFNLGGDLYVMTYAGIIPFSSVASPRGSSAFENITENLGTLIATNGRMFVDNNHEFLYVVTEQPGCYVQNLKTKAWTEYVFAGNRYACELAVGDNGRIAVASVDYNGLNPKIEWLGGGCSDGGTPYSAVIRSGWDPFGTIGARRKVNLAKMWFLSEDPLTVYSDVLADWNATPHYCEKTTAASAGPEPHSPTFGAGVLGDVFQHYFYVTSATGIDPGYNHYIGTVLYIEEAGSP